MADNNVVHIGENSHEQVAYKLLQMIMSSENKVTHHNTSGRQSTADRDYILSTYAEALQAVKGNR